MVFSIWYFLYGIISCRSHQFQVLQHTLNQTVLDANAAHYGGQLTFPQTQYEIQVTRGCTKETGGGGWGGQTQYEIQVTRGCTKETGGVGGGRV